MNQQKPACDICGGVMRQVCARCGKPACYNCGRIGMHPNIQMLCPGHKDEQNYLKRWQKEAKRNRSK